MWGRLRPHWGAQPCARPRPGVLASEGCAGTAAGGGAQEHSDLLLASER